MIKEHGELDLQKLFAVLSGILSDRYKAEITVKEVKDGSV